MYANYLEKNQLELDQLFKQEALFILPVGSTEQHGYHLPVGTDTFIVDKIAKEAAGKARGRQVIILPTIWSGVSWHHMDFPGTITISCSTLITLVREICKSLRNHGAEIVLILNGHGGNRSSLEVAVTEIGKDLLWSPILVTYWHFIKDKISQICPDFSTSSGHSCELETSLMLYLFPEHVIKEKFTKGIVRGDLCSPHMFRDNLVFLFKKYVDYSPSGVIGDPFLSSKEKGQEIFEFVTDRIAELIESL